MTRRLAPKRTTPPRQKYAAFKFPCFPGHHRLVVEMSELVVQGKWQSKKLCHLAGIGSGTLAHWHNEGAMPTLGNFDAVLNAMGYELCIRKRVIVMGKVPV